MTIYGLTEDDLLTLRGLIQREKQRGVDTRRRPEPSRRLPQAPEAYAAYTARGGIPGRSGLTVYSTLCQVYQLTASPFTLEEVPGLEVLVHNIDALPVPAEAYIPIGRDKFGKWWALCAGCYDPDWGTGTASGTYDGSTGTGTGTGSDQVVYGWCCPDVGIPTVLPVRFYPTHQPLCTCDFVPVPFPGETRECEPDRDLDCAPLSAVTFNLYYRPVPDPLGLGPPGYWTSSRRYPFGAGGGQKIFCEDDLIDTGIRIPWRVTGINNQVIFEGDLRVLMYVSFYCTGNRFFPPNVWFWNVFISYVWEYPSAESDYYNQFEVPPSPADCTGQIPYPAYRGVAGALAFAQIDHRPENNYDGGGPFGIIHHAGCELCDPFCVKFSCLKTWLGCWNWIDNNIPPSTSGEDKAGDVAFHKVQMHIGYCPCEGETGTDCTEDPCTGTAT